MTPTNTEKIGVEIEKPRHRENAVPGNQTITQFEPIIRIRSQSPWRHSSCRQIRLRYIVD